jgi:hypothetical protein
MDHQSRTPSEHPDALATFCAEAALGCGQGAEVLNSKDKIESMRDIKAKLTQGIRKNHLVAREKKLRNCDFELRNLSPSKKVILQDIYK